MDELPEELQVQLVAIVTMSIHLYMMLVNLQTANVSLKALLEIYHVYLLIRKNKRKMLCEYERHISRDILSTLVDSINNIGTLYESTSHGIRDVAKSFENISNYFNISAGSEYQQKVYEDLLAIEDLRMTEEQMVEVGEIIASIPSTSKFFFSLPPTARKVFVWKKLGSV